LNKTGNTRWDYLKALVGTKFKAGMTTRDMLFILAGPSALPGDSLNDLCRKWVGTFIPSRDGQSIYDWLQNKLPAGQYVPGDSLNEILRKIYQG
jgi:hypothetical protein